MTESKESRSPTSVPSPSTQRQDGFLDKHQLLQLCDLALPFLICLMNQDSNPPSHIASISNSSWEQSRNRLDDIYCDLASWRRDVGYDNEASVVHHDEDLTSGLDKFITEFLVIAHRFSHLVNISNKDTHIKDPVLLEVTQDLITTVDRLQEERKTVDDRCPVCGQKEVLEREPDYLNEIQELVRTLKESSRPLQLVMRRREWLEQFKRSTERRLTGDNNLDQTPRRTKISLESKKKPTGASALVPNQLEANNAQTGKAPGTRRKGSLTTQKSGQSEPHKGASRAPSAQQLEPFTTLGASQTRAIARPSIRRTRSMKSKGNQDEAGDIV